jgi:hypothetical protein
MSTFQEADVNVPVGPPMLDNNSGLHYDDAGNGFVRGADGTWIPHHGYALVCTISSMLTLLTSFFFNQSLAHGIHLPNGPIQGPCCPSAVPGHWSNDQIDPLLRPVEVSSL